MRQQVNEKHFLDENGNPSGGHTTGRGIHVVWQSGPLSASGGERLDPNGAFVEGVIEAALGRLRFYQLSKFACDENEQAIKCLEAAIQVLDQRTANRRLRGVEGTHEV